jgi:hypothetical protein
MREEKIPRTRKPKFLKEPQMLRKRKGEMAGEL